MTFLNSTEDLDWLFDTHLKNTTVKDQRRKFKASVFYGNQDAPSVVELYTRKNPLVTHAPGVVVCCKCGKTDSMIKHGDEWVCHHTHQV